MTNELQLCNRSRCPTNRRAVIRAREGEPKFNAICENPMLVILSFARRSDGEMKHTLANLLRTGEFVVNLVDEGVANGMHVSSKEYDENVSEFSEAGLIDPRTRRIADERYRPVGRLYASRYGTTRQRFELPGLLPEE